MNSLPIFIFNVAAIAIVVGILMYTLSMAETGDLFCPNTFYTKDKSLCKDGNGKFHQSSIFTGKETLDESLDKIRKGAASVTNHVFWRRFMLGAIPTTIVIFLFVIQKWPTVAEFFITVFLFFMCSYFTQTFYNYHFYRSLIENINSHVDNVEAKLREPECVGAA